MIIELTETCNSQRNPPEATFAEEFDRKQKNIKKTFKKNNSLYY
jgi:hypothetical protein